MPTIYDPVRIVATVCNMIHAVQREVKKRVRLDPTTAFANIRTRWGKELLGIDYFAETMARFALSRDLHDYDPLVIGEESLDDPNLDLSTE